MERLFQDLVNLISEQRPATVSLRWDLMSGDVFVNGSDHYRTSFQVVRELRQWLNLNRDYQQQGGWDDPRGGIEGDATYQRIVRP
jgi:hypothetical protein